MKSKMTATQNGTGSASPRGFLSKLTMTFFRRPWLTGTIWLVLLVFGAMSYTTLLKREGFPSIDIPITIVNGTYIVNDASRVDGEVVKPISDVALQLDGVTAVQAQSLDNFFSVVIQYKEGTDAKTAAKALENAVNQDASLPDTARIQYSVPYFGATGPESKKIDIAISFYDASNKTDTVALHDAAKKAVEYLNQNKPPLVETYFIQDQFTTATDPATGQSATIQKSFDRYGARESEVTKYYNSVIIGVSAIDGADVIKLDDQVRAQLGALDDQPGMADYETAVTAGFANAIRENINELQRVLLEGLLAVLVVGSLVIAIRASLITVISMISVITITLGLLYLIGYSLNVITLFALILGLSLVVDDTIIMIEALDVSRKRHKKRDEAVASAAQRVSRAMVAATVTAALSFAPLLFVGGVLGGFIRAIPVTIISSLIISLFVALIFIPFFARFLILGKKQMGEAGMKEVGATIEARIANAITWPMRWARRSRKKLVVVGLMAVMIGVGFVAAAGVVGRNVAFNIFPPTKDTNGLTITLAFAPNTTLSQAQGVTDKASAIAAEVIGANFEYSSLYNSGTATGATQQIAIIPYSTRDITSQELVKQLEARYEGFEGANVQVGQQDVGPPASSFAVRIVTEDREAGLRLANDVSDYLKTVELTRPNGSVATIRSVNVSSPNQFVRTDGKLNIQVSAAFTDTDTSTLVTLAQNALTREFDAERIAQYGLNADALKFDLGQESENQDSFKVLVFAFPALMLVIYVVLAFQFRSLLQPLLIFLALPFSLLGVTLGLTLTDNPFSFFAMLGFFALIGLSLKNTILLADYANQARRAGLGVIDATVEALTERFRPLIATSLTAIVSLIPLAIISPFWQGLAVVLIFGLLSSTFLVITVFPYYYLGGEFLRQRVSRRTGLMWLAIVVASVVAASVFGQPILLLVPLLLLGMRTAWYIVRSAR